MVSFLLDGGGGNSGSKAFPAKPPAAVREAFGGSLSGSKTRHLYLCLGVCSFLSRFSHFKWLFVNSLLFFEGRWGYHMVWHNKA